MNKEVAYIYGDNNGKTIVYTDGTFIDIRY